MHHSATQNFQPTRALTNAAIGSSIGAFFTENASYIDFCSRLYERKIAGSKANFALAVQSVDKLCQHALEIREAHPLIDQEPFNLVEHWRMCDVVISAIHRPTAHDRYWC